MVDTLAYSELSFDWSFTFSTKWEPALSNIRRLASWIQHWAKRFEIKKIESQLHALLKKSTSLTMSESSTAPLPFNDIKVASACKLILPKTKLLEGVVTWFRFTVSRRNESLRCKHVLKISTSYVNNWNV